MTRKPNPYIDTPNYWEGYNQKLGPDEVPNQPDKMEHLAWLVFDQNKDGKELLEEIEKKCVMPGQVLPGSDNFTDKLIFSEGYKHAFRSLRLLVESHKNRLKAENQKQET